MVCLKIVKQALGLSNSCGLSIEHTQAQFSRFPVQAFAAVGGLLLVLPLKSFFVLCLTHPSVITSAIYYSPIQTICK